MYISNQTPFFQDDNITKSKLQKKMTYAAKGVNGTLMSGVSKPVKSKKTLKSGESKREKKKEIFEKEDILRS